MPSSQNKYCIIKTVKHAFSNKVDVTTDYGMDINFSQEFETVTKFTSVVDALNYMSGQGWELVNTVSSGNILELHHIMKKYAE